MVQTSHKVYHFQSMHTMILFVVLLHFNDEKYPLAIPAIRVNLQTILSQIHENTRIYFKMHGTLDWSPIRFCVLDLVLRHRHMASSNRDSSWEEFDRLIEDESFIRAVEQFNRE